MTNGKVSIRPGEFVEGGAVPVDRNLLWKECRFDLFQYPARKDGTVVLGKDGQPAKSVSGRIIYQDDEGNEYIQHYSVGDPERFIPSEDGKTLVAVGSAQTLLKSSNFYLLMNALINAGFPENRLDEDISTLDSLYTYNIGIPEPKRTGLVREAPAEGARERILSVPSQIHKLPWENKGKGKVAPVRGRAAIAEEEAGDTADETIAMVAMMLESAESITRQQLATKAIREKKQEVAKFVFTPEFQVALLQNGYTIDGEEIKAG